MPKILLVEDDSNLREIYGARLEAEGYQIVSASDGEQALALAVREQPDLIISDVMMPKISGFDMLDILRSTPETKDVKVIVMTALSQEEDRQRGEQLGANRYVVKSQVTLDDVVTMVQELLSGTTFQTPQTASPQFTDPLADPVDQTLQQQAAPAFGQPQVATQPDPAALQSEVQDFVATSPLMNGSAPQPAQPAPTQEQSPQQPPVVLDQIG
jgi:DNA-binding response OmpR family regulator